MAKTKNPNKARGQEHYEKTIKEYNFKKGDPHTIECGRKGGLAAAKANRVRKSMADDAKVLLTIAMKKGELIDIEDLDNMQQAAKTNITTQQAILLKMIQQAINGDVKAAAYIRDTIGENPVQKAKVEADMSGSFEIIEGILEQMEDDNEDEDN